jgi:hypothetical protein
MNTENITLQIDPEAARIFKTATAEEREKLQVLLSIWLKDLGMTGTQSLKETMDEIGATASARGLTAELLDEILEEN